MSDHNGLCPFAEHKLIPAGSNDPAIKPRVAILHVDAGDNESLYEFFRDRSGGIESHFHVRKDGVIEQYRSIWYQADANHLGNDFAVSIETQGLGEGEWNDKQIAAIKRLLSWLNDVADIPLVKCPKWDGAGVGYHVQFGAPGKWTPVAKSCPGPKRIEQFNKVLVPWMQEESKPKRKPRKPQEAVSLANVRKAARIANWTRYTAQKALREDAAIVQAALAKEGVKRYREWQTKQGVKGNGVPDEKSLKALGRKHGFKVTD